MISFHEGCVASFLGAVAFLALGAAAFLEAGFFSFAAFVLEMGADAGADSTVDIVENELERGGRGNKTS